MTQEELVSLALSMRERAYAPYSHFRVGAALDCEDGTVSTGCNVENAAYGACICGERTALVKAVSEGQRTFRTLAIAGSGGEPCWPCGICRQMLAEFSPNLLILAVNDGTGEVTKCSLKDLLPHHFNASQLT